jgi:flagellin
MTLSLLTNTSSLSAQRALAYSTRMFGETASRLSSGRRIVTAADDSAGLAISERLSAQIRSYAQAERNTNDGISLLQTAEGALAEVSDLLGRMRELAVQSSTATLGTSDREAIQSEFSSLRSEIDRIAEVTEFNGRKLLDGSLTSLSFRVGIDGTSDDQIEVAIDSADSSDIGGAPALSAANVSTASGALDALNIIDESINDISAIRADVGSSETRLGSAVNVAQSARYALSSAISGIRDADFAEETANFARQNILVQAGIAVLAQANQQSGRVLDLLRFETT